MDRLSSAHLWKAVEELTGFETVTKEMAGEEETRSYALDDA
jgi:hypothetical protein